MIETRLHLLVRLCSEAFLPLFGLGVCAFPLVPMLLLFIPSRKPSSTLLQHLHIWKLILDCPFWSSARFSITILPIYCHDQRSSRTLTPIDLVVNAVISNNAEEERIPLSVEVERKSLLSRVV